MIQIFIMCTVLNDGMKNKVKESRCLEVVLQVLVLIKPFHSAPLGMCLSAGGMTYIHVPYLYKTGYGILSNGYHMTKYEFHGMYNNCSWIPYYKHQ